MDNQDLTMERRLKAKDKRIAELLEALQAVIDYNYGESIYLDFYLLKRKCKEAIRKGE